jgi:hypothetical protein
MMQSAVEVDPSVQLAAVAIEWALLAPEGDVTPAIETQIQNALHALRSTSGDRELLSWFAELATSLRMLAEAKRQGRTNLYMSQLLRLRRRVFH